MGFVALDRLEISAGFVFGARRSPRAGEDPDLEREPAPFRRVLERQLLEALSSPPCFVAFSGGRDSSAVLAAAAEVARRHGLQLPIPLTALYPGQPQADESEWQEVVLRHLGLDKGVQFEVTADLDALGPLAASALRRHGSFWPSNGQAMALFARQVGTGTMLTGGGGDELFDGWSWRRRPFSQVVRLRPRRRVLRWGAYYSLPLRLRQRLRRRSPVELPWLTEEGHQRLHSALEAATVPQPSYAEDLDRYVDSRYLECVRTTLETFAGDEGLRLVEPFYTPELIRAVGRESPGAGFPDRTASLDHFFGHLLPGSVIGRTSKAYFTSSAWGPAAKAFVERWDGRSGVDLDLVDADRVRTEWREELPDGRTVPLLHAAWLVQDGDSGT